MYAFRGSEVGTRRVVDAALISDSRTSPFPLIAVEAGFTQGFENLFDSAERLFRGTYREIQLVILVKIEEKTRHQGREFPWGILHNDVDTLRDMDKAHTLAPTIVRFYEGNRLKIIGDLEVKVYWYPRDRKTRPTIYSFKYDPQVHLLGVSLPTLGKDVGHSWTTGLNWRGEYSLSPWKSLSTR